MANSGIKFTAAIVAGLLAPIAAIAGGGSAPAPVVQSGNFVGKFKNNAGGNVTLGNTAIGTRGQPTPSARQTTGVKLNVKSNGPTDTSTQNYFEQAAGRGHFVQAKPAQVFQSGTYQAKIRDSADSNAVLDNTIITAPGRPAPIKSTQLTSGKIDAKGSGYISYTATNYRGPGSTVAAPSGPGN